MKLRLAGLGVALCAVACGQGASNDFRDVTPSADALTVTVPESGSAKTTRTDGNLHTRSQALQGDVAGLYIVTRETTQTVNGWTRAVLNLVHDITEHPATSRTGNVAIWGPSTDALSPNTWRLTVTRNAPHHFHYVLEARAKTTHDDTYVTILTGDHAQATDASGDVVKHSGSGSFVLDWTAFKTLPENDGNTGRGTFTYSRSGPEASGTVDVVLSQMTTPQRATPIDFTYHFDANGSTGGNFRFDTLGNLDGDDHPTRTALESLHIQSRWQTSGAGRSDLRAEGGDLTTPATATECWDANFASVYFTLDFDPARNYGDPASCVFAAADFPAQ